ncbi:MAG: SCP2 sterol-binding domain-containing protein [Deltaproteobacteria bacterium]|nr:SCP2 sterol-binding domain-containing protein [Deltaproteobacteria bacterium]
MSEQTDLTIVDRDRMSLLGLMLGGVLERSLASTEGRSAARKLSGNLGVTAGKMSVTLHFDGGAVTVTRGLDDRLKARVRGSLDGLLQISLGRGPVRSFLAGEVSFKGNPFFVLKALPLMRVQPDVERANS